MLTKDAKNILTLHFDLMTTVARSKDANERRKAARRVESTRQKALDAVFGVRK